MTIRPLKRPKPRRRQSKQAKARQLTTQQLMRQQQELLEKYEQRLKQLQPMESSEDETSFTIAGKGAERPGIGYQSPIVLSEPLRRKYSTFQSFSWTATSSTN
ncbi:hypothetical protein SARC_04655 [Sphaeroforma arctica JP610]|uniref:Uncharacterized protein n=1 Tax=Sphaeroforma arctica JP610 TaxID=667725 RepID=A0A0L0G4E8_9EUKA|nr:hypothetical protein SARC_04655 [Sphaeroforma arctica JP610]KNC83078.1 hypothetical protein SARC_04655 [Sphaeroforma arctica JP610]|eukprot:XP_014156980.1 hypothetical protein SARC_04655 [Sphaeroforma arctica JP610]